MIMMWPSHLDMRGDEMRAQMDKRFPTIKSSILYVQHASQYHILLFPVFRRFGNKRKGENHTTSPFGDGHSWFFFLCLSILSRSRTTTFHCFSCKRFVLDFKSSQTVFGMLWFRVACFR